MYHSILIPDMTAAFILHDFLKGAFPREGQIIPLENVGLTIDPAGAFRLVTSDKEASELHELAESELLFARCVQLGADRAAVAGWPDFKRRSFIEDKEYGPNARIGSHA